mgnify:CR=1 FL=1
MVGIDVVAVDRIKKAIGNPRFVERVFTDIWSRCAHVQDNASNRVNLARILDDIGTFYKLVSA